MGKILEAFANDELSTQRQSYDPDSDYGAAEHRFSDLERSLRSTLTEAEAALLEELLDAQCDLADQYSSERFQRGYRLGMLMLWEVLEGRGDLIGEPV